MQNLILTLILCFSLTANAQTYAKYNGKKESAKTTVRTEDEKTVEKLIMIADDFLNKKQFADAAKYYTEALAYNINVSRVTEGRGMAYFFGAEYEKAIADFDAVLPIAEKPAGIYFNRGLCKHNLHDLTGACDDLTMAKLLDKAYDDPKMFYLLCEQ
ncbi:tetratricopeptide repeat protein [Flavobacterium zepuense]|uniref:Tetratricopeptide repeat protein n=1 Tax=Flavobacterium zepuense TaxID=2593302 RepID=A0A552UXS2_9FLAO|nr:tetratricopeptide repeat protein [Flavobacterium zepuense]TRW23007.1 tetratricopeptide repeat protein [Flavobacterium zepuense]